MNRVAKLVLVLLVVLILVGLATFIPVTKGIAVSISSTVWQVVTLSSIPAGASVDSTIHQIVCLDPVTYAIVSCGGGAPSGAAGGVLGGTYPNPDFNSTNTAGNTMNNALQIVNPNANNNSYDISIQDAGICGGQIEIMNYPSGGAGFESYSGDCTVPSGETIDMSVHNHLGSGVDVEMLACDSGDYTGGTGHPGYCSENGTNAKGFLVLQGRLGADTINNVAGTGSPAFPNGAGVAITIAGGYPICDAGHNLNALGFVVDAASCADGVQPTGGGGTHCPVFCDGVKWRALYTVATSTPLPTQTPTATPTP